MSNVLRSLAICLSIGGSGCAASDQLFAGRADYRLYRETRVAPTPEARLGAANRYLKEMRDGAFYDEVKRDFDREEAEFFRASHDRPSQLKAYLRNLPDGPHAKAAAERLLEFDLLNSYYARRRERAETALKRIENDLVRAELGRKELVARLVELARLLSQVRDWGAATAELDHQLIYRFRLEPPSGECDARKCQKSFEVRYAVPENKRIAPRTARFTLRFDLESGGVERIRVSGPALFSRLSEALDKTAVSQQNLLHRTEAIGRAVQTLENAIEASLPRSRCAREVIAPVVISRECEGLRFQAQAAIEPHEEDFFEVMRAPRVATE